MDWYTGDNESIWTVFKHNLKGHRKCFELTYYEKNRTNGYHIREFWTDRTAKELASWQYKKADGFLEKLRYSFTKCYAKLMCFREAEPSD